MCRRETDVAHEFKYRGCTGQVIRDDNPDSPDGWRDEGAFLVYDHRQFCIKRDGFEPRDIYQYMVTNGVEEELKKSEDYEPDHSFDDYKIWLVYAYIHSGVALSLGRNTYPFNDQWDVSATGFVLVKKDECDTEEGLQKIAEGIVKSWNQYLQGDVYACRALDETGEEIETVWGYYADSPTDEYLLSECRGHIDQYVDEKLRKHLEKVKRYIICKVPYQYREHFAF